MKFLIAGYTGLGNFILKTPLIRAIHNQFPDSSVDILYGTSWGAENVLAGSGLVRKNIWCGLTSTLITKVKALIEIRNERYDVIILPFDSTPTFLRLFLPFLGATHVVSHLPPLVSPASRFRAALRLVSVNYKYLLPVPAGRHEIDLNLDLLGCLISGPVDFDRGTFVNWTKSDISHFGAGENYVVIQPSARNGVPSPKVWDPDNFVHLIEWLTHEYRTLKIVLVGDRGDAGAIANSFLSEDRIVNLMGNTSFNDLCNVIIRAKLVIAHDSGVMHVADALRRPLVALYGPTDHTRTMPLRPDSFVLHSKNNCWAKMYNFQTSENKLSIIYPKYYCMSGISVADVINIVIRILEYK